MIRKRNHLPALGERTSPWNLVGLSGVVGALWLGLVAAACSGSAASTPDPTDLADASPAPIGPGQDGGTDATAPLGVDPGWVGVRRLNHLEYDNTVKDLLGVKSARSDAFLMDESLYGFDNIDQALVTTPARYEQYFNAAKSLADDVFGDATLRGRIMICVPSSGDDPATCTTAIIKAFGVRAWRRPLTDPEIATLAAFAAGARARGADFTGSIKLTVIAMLSSSSFLHHVEADPEPSSTKVRPVLPYDMASRLSYLAWSTMPDDELFARAADGALASSDTVAKELDRLLDDPRSDAFVHSFGGQWLGVRDLDGHTADPTVFPTWTASLGQAMQAEAYLYFNELLRNDHNLSELLTSDVNFVNRELAQHYGIAGTFSDDELTRVEATGDMRKGYFGLAAFLTMTSTGYRTSYMLRGVRVLRDFLCLALPPPPANIALPPPSDVLQTPRQTFEAIDRMPPCASCHQLMDPIGYALDNFDAIGQYRTESDGHPIDARGSIPYGIPVNGLLGLADAMGQKKEFLDCATRKLLIYGLGRGLQDTDDPYLAEIATRWSQHPTLRNLLKQIVLNDVFRMRRGGATLP